MRAHTTNELIAEIEKIATEPYSEWKIGVSESGKMEDEGCVSTVVFNPHNSDAVIAAYNHFKEKGMTVKPCQQGNARYLYLFKNTWIKHLEVNF